MIWTIFGVFFPLALLVAAPMAISMGIAGLAALLLHTNVPLVVMPQRVFVMLDSFPMMAVPYFILAGVFMDQGGISARLVRFATALVGRFTGGLAMVTVLATMIISGLSGSGAADTAAIGSLMIPALVRKGYPRGYAAALQGAAGALGPIIPPSIIMILYAGLVNQSPARMFMGGIVPGILIGIGFMVLAYIYARRNKLGAEPPSGCGEIFVSFADAGWALVAPVIILGGIVGGVFTATEAGVVAVLYALFVGLFIYRELHLRDLPRLLVEGAWTTTLVMFIVGVAGLFGWLLALSGAPQAVTALITSITTVPVLAALLVLGFIMVAGGFVEVAVLIIIFIPVLHPLGATLGYNDLHWAVVLSMILTVGSVTPPVADFLYIATALAQTNMNESSRYVWPFVLWLVVVIVLCLLVPDLVLALPRVLLG